MKIQHKFLLAVALISTATGCNSFLDINNNPNSPTSVTPDAILASALATTAANYMGGVGTNGTNYNSYASFAVDYWGKSGVVSGYSEERTYNYTTQYYQNLWGDTYDNLNDYNTIQQRGTNEGYANHAAIARIMKVYNFLLLVDEYGDIPYTNALQAAANTAPAYDKAADIYKDFIVQLDSAVVNIDAAGADAAKVGSEDIVFSGSMTKWKQFANSLKLRILLRESQTGDAALNSYVATQMTALQNAPDGFITADVVVQPKYAQSANQQNPFWNRYGQTPTGARATQQLYQIPTNYILAQYIDNKDPRVAKLYTKGAVLMQNRSQPAYFGTDAGERNPPAFTDTTRTASRFLVGGALLKGPTAPTVLMLLSEQLFSKAEAETRNLFSGGDATAKEDYLKGIEASFTTFGASDYDKYISDNVANPKVNYDLAPSSGVLGKQALIIYQKYLAMNTLASTEAWDDYRRTAQPNIQPSLESASPRADKLPTRLLYPQTELSTNKTNVPKGVDQFTKIFWDVVD